VVGRFPSDLIRRDLIRRDLIFPGLRVLLGVGQVARVALLLLLLLAACAFPGTVRPTVKVGLVAPFEGRYRYVGYDVIYAVQLALFEANRDGGVAGYGVELVAYDDGASPTAAVAQARKLEVDPAVVSTIGHFREDTTAAAIDTYAQAGIPLISPALLSPGITENPETVYRLGSATEPLAHVLLGRALRLAPHGEFIVIGQSGPLEAALQRAAREWTGKELPVVSADVPGWDMEILDRDPSILFCDLEPVRAGEVVSVLRQRGWSGRVLGGPALAPSDFAAVAGQAAADAIFVTPWPFPSDVPDGEAFVAAYRRVSNGVEPGPLALPAYEATWTLLEALEQAGADGEITRKRVGAALSDARRRGILGDATGDDTGESSPVDLYWYRIEPDGVPEFQG
jgi:branched-chain amino acid transport system substrate-binding protein